MSNKAGTLKINMTYKGASNEVARLPECAVSFSYMAQSHGTVDVPTDALEAAEITIPFGSVGTHATMVVIQNRTGQDVEVKVNGQAPQTHHHDLASGGVLILGGPLVPADNKLTEVTFTLSDDQLAFGAGEIEYHVFGDPV